MLFILKYINYFLFASFKNKKFLTISSENFLADPSIINTALESDGIVVIKNFIDQKVAKNIYYQILEFEKEYTSQSVSNKFLFNHEYLNYQGILNKNNLVINFRGYSEGIDGGMIDVFRIDKYEKFDSTVNPFKIMHGCYKDNIEKSFKKNFSHFNLYINKSVSNTRTAHVDHLKDEIKCFLYLTDVSSEECGPYAYVPGSHHKKRRIRLLTILLRILFKLRIIREYSYHDIPMPKSSLKPILANIGDLVISNQSGIHRGLPQSVGKERYVIVDNYKNFTVSNNPT